MVGSLQLIGVLLCAGSLAEQLQRHPPSYARFMSGARRGSRSGSAVFHPADFGGDPSGEQDSTAAVQRAIQAASSQRVPGHFIGNLSDTGGSTVDLQGGEYRISKGLWLGDGGGMRICCGSLIADGSFPVDEFMLNAGHQEDITVEDVAFECNRRGGAVATSSTLRVHLSRVYVVHFATVGIRVSQGHEVHIGDSYIGEFLWGEPGSGTGTASNNLTATAVEIDGQDHWLSDLIVFSALYGIVINGGALVLTNTHIYNGGEEALRVIGHAVRVLGCYFDFNKVLVLDPVAVDISHSMFLGGTGLEIRASQPGAVLSGLHVVHNQFVVGAASHTGPWEAIYLNETAGVFEQVNGTVIAHNANPPATYGAHVGLSQHLKQTVVQQTLQQKNATLWRFELRDRLLFSTAVAPLHVTFAVEAEAGFPRAVLRPVTDGAVVIESEVPFTGAVHVSVHQAGKVHH